MFQTSPFFSWIVFSCQNLHWPSYLAALTISFWTFKCGYLKEESTLSSFMRQAKSQNNWGWQGHPSLFCACLSSGPVSQFQTGTLIQVAQSLVEFWACQWFHSMSVISQTLWAPSALNRATHRGSVRCTKERGHIESKTGFVKEALPRCPSSSQPQVSSSSFKPAALCQVKAQPSSSRQDAKAHCPHLCGFQQCPAEPWQAQHPCG